MYHYLPSQFVYADMFFVFQPFMVTQVWVHDMISKPMKLLRKRETVTTTQIQQMSFVLL